MFTQIWSERLKENQHTGDLSAGERILLKLVNIERECDGVD